MKRRVCVTGRFLDVVAATALASSLAVTLMAAPPERHRLYSKPEPSAGGGIQGVIDNPSMPIEQILAIPPDEPRLVYEGTISGSSRRDFSFQGLPMRKYDLVVIYKDCFYEGLKLSREEDTLTGADRQKVSETIEKAEPYFTRKIIHRLEGTTGRGNECRCIATYLRDRLSTEGPAGDKNMRRTFKIVILKDVGPGWQVVRARDLYPVWTTKGQLVAAHHHSDLLSGIRVTRSMKDVGRLNLKSLR